MESRTASGNIGGEGQEPFTADDVAAAVGGRLIGPGDVALHGVAPLDRAGPTEISLLSHARYASWFSQTRAGTVLVTPDLEHLESTAVSRIVVDKPVDAMVKLLPRFHRSELRPEGIHPSAVIAPDVVIGEGVSVEAFVTIGAGTIIANDCWIGAGASIGAYVRIGAHSRIHSAATIYQGAEIGDRVIVHSGARVGREGFGFVPRDGSVVRIPHVGRCVLQDDVEIGANSCVDRGSIDDTVIGAGTKIDNLVQVGHNVRIGRMCFIAAQTGISGSVRIGDGTQLGGQAGVSGHLTIGAKVSLAAKAGVFGDIPDGQTWSGYPARPHREQLRATAALFRLARIIRPLEELLQRNRES